MPKRIAYRNPDASAVGTLPEGVGLPPGTPMPDVAVAGTDGQPVRLKELASGQSLMVVFYRGGWCPYCNFQIHDLTEAAAEFKKRGVTPVAISVDRAEEAKKTRATYDIPFPVLSDPKLTAHHAFKVAFKVDDPMVEKLKAYDIDIEAASGEEHHMLAVPSIFVVDRQGTIRWAHAEADYKLRPSTEQLLAAIDKAL